MHILTGCYIANSANVRTTECRRKNARRRGG
nr:MAG TPA: hypothetical protein [Caudoviricetes sp.]